MKLKNCLKCGARPSALDRPGFRVEWSRVGSDATRRTEWMVCCMRCGQTTKFEFSKERAVEAWNKQNPVEQFDIVRLKIAGKPIEALVLELRYHDGLRWKDVAKYAHFSVRHCHRIAKRGIKYINQFDGIGEAPLGV